MKGGKNGCKKKELKDGLKERQGVIKTIREGRRERGKKGTNVERKQERREREKEKMNT